MIDANKNALRTLFHQESVMACQPTADKPKNESSIAAVLNYSKKGTNVSRRKEL
jgi:hypothetical protein